MKNRGVAEFYTSIHDTPYLVKVLSWEKYIPAQVHGDPWHCYPVEGGVGEYILVGDEGKVLAEDILTEEEIEQLEQKIFEHMEGE